MCVSGCQYTASRGKSKRDMLAVLLIIFLHRCGSLSFNYSTYSADEEAFAALDFVYSSFNLHENFQIYAAFCLICGLID